MSSPSPEAATLASPSYAPPLRRLTFVGLLRSEWIKFWSVRSVVFPMALAAICIIALSAALTAVTVNLADSTESAGVDLTTAGSLVATLVVAVIGVISITGEYRTGMIRTSLSAAPRRLPVLWAKSVVLAVAVVLILGTALFVAFFIGQAILATANRDSGLGHPGVLPVLVGNVVVLVGVALVGLGLGALLRNTAGAICAVLGLLFVMPLALLPLPSFPGKHLIQDYQFLNTTASLTASDGADLGGLPLGTSLIAFTAWVVLFLACGAISMRKGDA